MEEAVNQLKRNTKFLFSNIKNQGSLLNKVEVVEQVYMNLKVLKNNISEEEYALEFKEIERKIDTLIEKMTDRKLLEELLDNLKKVLNLDI